MSDSTKSKDLEKEVKAVSRLVNMKLDLYINREKRENRFEPHGTYRTTHKMAPYDLTYKVLEITKLDKKQQKKKNKESADNGKNDRSAIHPKLANSSMNVTLKSEVDRLTKYANEVFESIPVNKLCQVHRYRPHSALVPKTIENGHVHNYSRHVGAALHQCAYANYYNEQGLKSADPKRSKRMQGLTPRKEESAKDSDTSKSQAKKDENGKEKKNTKQQENTKHQEKQKSGSPRKTSNNKSANKKPERNRSQPIKIEVRDDAHSRSESPKDDDDKYSDDFDEESRPQSQAENDSDKLDDKDVNTADDKKDAVSYTDDFESDNESVKGKTTNDQQKELTENQTGDDYSMNYESDTSDKRTIKAESSDADSVVSEDEVTKSKNKKTRPDTTSHRSEDAISVQTYTSVEHAYDRDVKRD